MQIPGELTYHEVREALRPIGIVISKKKGICRINYFGGTSETAFFTDCLSEAFQRGQDMSAKLKRPAWSERPTRLRP